MSDWTDDNFDEDGQYDGPWIPPEDFAEMMSRRASGEAKIKHNRYMRSDEWRRIRLSELARANYRCEECGRRNYRLDVHHLTYIHFGHEQDHREDLRVLCEDCHAKAHGRLTAKVTRA